MYRIPKLKEKCRFQFFQRDQRQWSNVIGMISPSLSSFVKMYALVKQKVAGMWQQQKKKGVGPLEAIDRQIELVVKERQRQRVRFKRRSNLHSYHRDAINGITIKFTI